MKAHPDANTLWVEDGVNIATGANSSDKHWSVRETSLFVSPNSGDTEGFNLESVKANQHATGRYVDFDADYPYLEWEVSSVDYHEGYHQFLVQVLGAGRLAGSVTQIPLGIFTQNMSYTVPGTKQAFLRFDLNGAKVSLKYLKLVRHPNNFIAMESPVFATKKAMDLGDEITFRVTLANPAEDVSLRVYHSYIMKQLAVNGKQTLQLRPEDPDRKIWSTTVTLDSLDRGHLKPNAHTYPAGSIYVKAIVLGGQLKTALWTANPVDIRLAPAPEPQ